jgi:glycosyltransferase involved in cell wall biosynthesis
MAHFLWKSKKWLKCHVRDYDVMHGLSGFHYSMAPVYYAHQFGLPSTLFVTNHQDEFLDKGGVKGLLQLPRRRREMLRQIDGVVAMSRAIYEEITGFGVAPRRIARIPMGVNTTRFAPCGGVESKRELRARLGLADRKTVLFVGALDRRKRPDLLIAALPMVTAAASDFQLALVGPAVDSVYRREMKQQAEQLGVAHRIVWVDHTAEVEQYHQASDLFALPSSNEGMPAAMVEAMSTGLPCIGTPISGISDLIEEDVNGRLVPQDAAAIAEAISHYLQHDAILAAHGAAGRSKVLKWYTCQVVLAAYCDLFRRVVAGQDPCDASTLPPFE